MWWKLNIRSYLTGAQAKEEVEAHAVLLTWVELENPKAACREHPLTRHCRITKLFNADFQLLRASANKKA
jgi:hypothetical protein